MAHQRRLLLPRTIEVINAMYRHGKFSGIIVTNRELSTFVTGTDCAKLFLELTKLKLREK